jgi:Carboxypeptidase regulatory-like domain/TonB-dependent Receptor Plug Domain/TonB dependent receptor
MQLQSRLFASLIMALGLAPRAFGQADTGTITGRVTDSTGATVAGVQVAVVQKETNFSNSSVTNNDGIFRVQYLQPGTYTVTFQASGFKRMIREGLVLRVGDVAPVDVALEVGALSESVEVQATAPLLETETSSLGTVTEGETLYKLAMYQRYITNTLTIVPGVTNNTQGGTNGLGAFYISGQRNTGTATFEDGVFANDPLTSNLLVIKPVMNSVDEVKVLTGTLPAEYGHSSGGVITTVKKSGTNEFHGAVSAFGRDRFMTHRQFFNVYTTAQPQFGNPNGVQAFFLMLDGNGGGPVVIPKVYNGKNRTFWYSGYNKLIEKKTQSYTSVTPTLAELGGDFSFGGAGQPIYNPYSTVQNADGTWAQRTPFPGNIVPKSMFDPVAAKILSYNIWRAPNSPGSFSSTGPVSNFTYNPPSRTYFEDFSERVDHQVNSNLRLYGSWTYNHENGLQRPTNIQVQVFDGFSGNNSPATQQNSSAGATYVISPTAVDELRLSYFRPRNDFFVPSANQNWAATLGIPNVSPDLMPSFSPANGLGINPVSTAPDYPQLYGVGSAQGATRQIRETLSLRDDFSKISGKHAFKMGYEILLFKDTFYQQGLPSGQFNFSNTTANLQPNGQPVPNTGNTFAAFELGAVSSAQFTTYTNTWQPRENINSVYFQDDWKFSSKLTLNLGLRWSTESPYHTAHGQQSQFSPTATDPLTGRMGAVLHPTDGLNNREWKNFQPRIGMAYHPREKWVLRGGVALYTIDIRWPNQGMQFDEYQAVVNQQRAANDPRVLFQLSQGPAPVVYNIQPNGTASYVGTNYSARNVTWLDPTLRPGYSMNWNVGGEYQINSTNLIKIFYAGSVGVHLVESWNINGIPTSFGAGDPTLQNAVFANTQAYLPYPQFGSINHMANTGHSSYHSGTVQWAKRYSKGLALDSFYTYSKTLDDCDNDYGTCTGIEPITNRNLSKGRAGFDIRHRFVTTVTYELPAGKGRHFLNRGGWVDAVLGGYDISWIQTINTGNPFGFTFANSPYNYYPTSSGTRFPNLVATPTMPQFGAGQNIGPDRFNQSGEYVVVGSTGGNPASYPNCDLPTCNISAFAPPPAFTPGNAGRNILTGPAAYFSQMSVKKNFSLSERFVLQLRFDFQNPFHNYAFAAPSSTVDFKNPKLFGKITGETATASIQGEPLMNLMLRLTF